MNALAIFVAVFPAMMVVGAILAPVLYNRRPPRQSDRVGPEYGGVDDSGLGNRRTPVDADDSALDTSSPDELTSAQGDQYQEDWLALQARFGE